MEEIVKEESVEKNGLLWAKECVDKHGFIYTLGLIRFITIMIEEEMAADIMQTKLGGPTQ
jgi:hypothetical protein